MQSKVRNIIATKKQKAYSLINSLIEKLPIELHLPGYNYCGPGTKLIRRVLNGDKPINKLDEACFKHDVGYCKNVDLQTRHQHDRELINVAWQISCSSDYRISQRFYAFIVVVMIKVKVKLETFAVNRQQSLKYYLLKRFNVPPKKP